MNLIPTNVNSKCLTVIINSYPKVNNLNESKYNLNKYCIASIANNNFSFNKTEYIKQINYIIIMDLAGITILFQL